MTDINTHDPLRRYLESLPLPEASDGLFDRVERTRGRRRLVRRVSIGATAILVLGLGVAPFLLTSAPPAPSIAGQQSDGDMQSPQLTTRPEEAELRLIDRQLAAAYTDAAPEGHIDTLWQRRRAAILRLEKEPIDERTVISL